MAGMMNQQGRWIYLGALKRLINILPKDRTYRQWQQLRMVNKRVGVISPEEMNALIITKAVR